MAQELLTCIGTFTRDKSEGIYVYRMDLSTGALTLASVARGIEDPAFLAIGPTGHTLYAVNHVPEFAGQPTGAVSAFSLDPETGELTLLNQQPSHGADPCHLCVDKRGRYVLVANYVGGSVAVLPIRDDGSLGEATDHIQHEGSSVNPKRQEGPHAHSINLDPDNRYAFVADLGMDKLMIYRFDQSQGKLTPHDPPWVQTRPGAGPRHFTFHPNGQYAYLINELDNTLVAYAYDGEQGTLQELQTVSALPEGFEGVSYCADVHVAPSGRFVYGSNRGHDSIVIFAIDEGSGRLTYVGHEPTQGQVPRGFAIDPTGTFLLVANQHTDTVVTFQIDQQTGKLQPTGHVVQVPTPVCIVMTPSRR